MTKDPIPHHPIKNTIIPQIQAQPQIEILSKEIRGRS
jgi:hypothetical protein